MTNPDPYLATQNRLRLLGVGTKDDRIEQALDAMNYTELRNAARRALVARAWDGIKDLGWNHNPEDMIKDSLDMATTFAMDQEREQFAQDLMEKGWPDDLAHANYYRRLLGLNPLDDDGHELTSMTWED